MIAERHDAGGCENYIAYDNQCGTTILSGAGVIRPRVATVSRVLECWYRRDYLDDYDGTGSAVV